MARESLEGLADAYALIDALPGAAEKAIGTELVEIGKIALDAQRATVPVDTGALKAGLRVLVQLQQLRVRIGLIGLEAGSRNSFRSTQRDGKERFSYGDLFYGVIVNFGRRAQLVRVERRRVGSGKLLRNGRKRVEDIVARYSMQVPAMAPREFIAPQPLLEGQLDARLADFWANTFSRVPGGN